MKTELSKEARVLRKIYVTYPYNTTQHTRCIYCSINAYDIVKKTAEDCETWGELKKDLKTLLKLHGNWIIAYTE